MTDPLVTFVRARLDEDAAAARRVRSSWRQIGETGVIVASDGEYAEECANGNWAGIAEHIVRHDPERVLAKVEAKRQVIEQYESIGTPPPGEVGPELSRAELGRVLRLLALPYSDHPDYDESWRP